MKQRPKLRPNEVDYFELANKNIVNRDPANNSPHVQKVVETVVNEGDTLASLSLQYHCPVAELKRINNFVRDNEIYARHTIKVPYRAFSMVAIHKSGDSSPNSDAIKKSVNAHILKEKLASVSTNFNGSSFINKHDNGFQPSTSSDDTKSTSNINEIIFNTQINEYKCVESEPEVLTDEEVQLLPRQNTTELLLSGFDCNGSDGGISWRFLLTVVLLSVVLIPLLYIFYVAEHPEKFHHQYVESDIVNDYDS